MRLWDEDSYRGLDPVEAKLRRIIFWHCFISDKSAGLLNNRPQQLNEFVLQQPITTSRLIDLSPPLLDADRNTNRGLSEEFILECFKKDLEVWDRGSSTLAELGLFVAANNRIGATMSDAQRRSLCESYMRFASVKDDMPQCINYSQPTTGLRNLVSNDYQGNGLWMQRANIFITYRYLNMTLLCRFAPLGYASLLGLGDDSTSLAWRKIEIAHEVLQEVNSVLLESVKRNGEPVVEKLRFICATLLEITQGQNMELVIERAKSHFLALLDVLSRLDSKVSDRLAALYA
ncbi:hypothetical protein FALCPG4_011415 [Fusarium falciforme]